MWNTLIAVGIYFVVTRLIMAAFMGYNGIIKTDSMDATFESLMEPQGGRDSPPFICMFLPVVGDFVFWIFAVMISIGALVHAPARLGRILRTFMNPTE